ncbi:MAG: rod shape-determining protein MreC [candidate division Zixibacteria bacterium]|nr:rod shape-determining protein MreC [candidate division Zixibacteria bacterium]
MLSSAIKQIKRKQLLPIFAAAFISIILIILPLSFKIAVSRVFITAFFYPIIQVDKFFTDMTHTKNINIELNQKLTQVSMQAAKYTEDHYENMRLRRMLNFDLQIPYRLIPAEVIGLNPGSMAKSIEINAGKDKGIGVNMPIITADGIIGKTIGVSGNSAVAQLLIDHNCKVSAIDQTTRAMGIIRWEGGRFLKMGDVPIESEVVVGDTIISSGLGGIFPPGLMVGTVIYAKNLEGTLFKNVIVKQAVDFGSLEEVFVVIYDE